MTIRLRFPAAAILLAATLLQASALQAEPRYWPWPPWLDLPAAERPPSQQVNCLPIDGNGKTLPNMPVNSICGQIDYQRTDCELMRMSTDEPMMHKLHCFEWRRVDVRPGVRGPESVRAQVQGGR
ncbi:MAG: hypothetical protein JO048_02655 [Methylobacteriaceae bacterium]|nr:hypothetical protein [Methylobacteriaceae bacterium]